MHLNTYEEAYKKTVEIIFSWEDTSLKEKLNKWLEQFSDREKILMLNLLCGFHYYSRNVLLQNCSKLFKNFTKDVPEWEDKTFFTKIYKPSGEAGHSDLFYTEFLITNNLKGLSTNNVEETIESLPDLKNFVVVDDYAGSGKSFIDTIKNKTNILLDFNIFFLVMNCSKVAESRIKKFSLENKLNINIIKIDSSEKAFDIDIIFDKYSINEMKELYKFLAIKHKSKYPFGFREVEALVNIYYNAPNNTLGLFWERLDNYFSLFTRYQDKYISLKKMKQERKKRDVMKGARQPLKNVDDYKILLFIAYCINKSTNFNVQEACGNFGLMENQIDEMIDYIIKKGYVINKGGIFKETDKLCEIKFKVGFNNFLNTFDGKTQDEVFKFIEKDYTPINFDKIFKGYIKEV